MTVVNAWRDVTLGDLEVESGGVIQTGPFGSQLHASDYSTVGVPVVMPTNISDLRVTSDDIARVSPEHVTRLARHRLQVGDIVYSRRGDVEKCALIDELQSGWLCGTGCLLVRVQGPSSDARCLAYLLSLPATRTWISQHAVGATMPNLNTSILREVPIALPPIEEQRGIAATLGALDDKIESNRRLVDLVPQLINAVVSEATDDRCRVAVADLAAFVNGGAYTKGASGTGRIVIRIAELNSGPGGSTVHSDIDVPDEKTARAGDLLMSWSGSLGVYRWALDEAIVNQHIFKVLPSDGYPAWLVHDRLDQVMPEFRGIAKDKATTMGHIQRGHLETTTVAVPSDRMVAELDEQLAPLWDRLLLAERESSRLAELRNTLLPELMSGRIRVPEATH